MVESGKMVRDVMGQNAIREFEFSEKCAGEKCRKWDFPISSIPDQKSKALDILPFQVPHPLA